MVKMSAVKFRQFTIDHLNKTVWAKIHAFSEKNLGLIAIRDIPEGQMITDYFSPLDDIPLIECTKKDFEILDPNIIDLILEKTILDKNFDLGGTTKFISPNGHALLFFFANHSNEPNCDINLISKRNINKGEEITFNYLDRLKNSKIFQGASDFTKKHHTYLDWNLLNK